MRDKQSKFTKIYEKNSFKGTVSKSGQGSDLEQTKEVRSVLKEGFINADFQSILDAPCGDCYWIKTIWNDIPMYIGADIVPELILENKEHHPTKTFKILDITTDQLPNTDLMLCRDCLVHMSFDEIYEFLRNFSKSEIPFLLTTSFTNKDRENISFTEDINWFPLNLQNEPFNFPEPVLIINEKCTECNGEFSDKSLVLYTRQQIVKAIS